MIRLILLLSIVSCQNYVRQMHQKISDPNGPQRQNKMSRTKQKDKRPIKDPITFSITNGKDEYANNGNNNKIQYKKRYKADDLIDNSDAPSLWSDYYSTSNLFSTNQRKKEGDIIVINVNKNLKEDISRELRKTFPLKTAYAPAPVSKGPASVNTTPQGPPKKIEDKEEAVIVFDKVSSRISEEVSDNYFLLKGRKEVYFRNRKHMVEVHALAKREDLSVDSEVMSDKVTETKVIVVR